jgi:hypothetical protein
LRRASAPAFRCMELQPPSGKGGCRWIFWRRLRTGAGRPVRRGPTGRSARTLEFLWTRSVASWNRWGSPEWPRRADSGRRAARHRSDAAAGVLDGKPGPWIRPVDRAWRRGSAAGRYRRESGLQLARHDHGNDPSAVFKHGRGPSQGPSKRPKTKINSQLAPTSSLGRHDRRPRPSRPTAGTVSPA